MAHDTINNGGKTMSNGREMAVKQTAEIAVGTNWEKMQNVIREKYPKASDGELQVFFYQAKKSGLDPLTNQIHLVTRMNRKTNKYQSTIQTGIDGFRAIADRTGTYAGADDAVFDEGLTQFQMIKAKRNPSTATVTVYKIVGGVRCPFVATAEWDAYYPGKEGGFMWEKMPYLMLAKCAEALALRKAFPAQLSGVYSDDEMHQADGVVEAEKATIKPAIPAPVEQEVNVDPALTEDPGTASGEPAEVPFIYPTEAQVAKLQRLAKGNGQKYEELNEGQPIDKKTASMLISAMLSAGIVESWE